VRSLRHKLWNRHGDPERRSFAFFVVGALVVIAVAMFLGFQLGRYAEKSPEKMRGGKAPQADSGDMKRGSRFRGDPEGSSAFSEEAVKVPAVPLPSRPAERRRRSEENGVRGQYPETLSRKDPLRNRWPGRRIRGQEAETTGEENREGAGCRRFRGGKFMLQAGAMKTRVPPKPCGGGSIGRVQGEGHRATTREHGELYRVRVGPFGSREEAMKAMKTIRDRMKLDVILMQG